MSRSKKSTPSLIELPLRDRETGDITVVVETPKGSHNKYKYDANCRALRLGAVLGEGLAFPYDFGFMPSTLGDDGDPLDVLLFLDHGVPPGCVATNQFKVAGPPLPELPHPAARTARHAKAASPTGRSLNQEMPISSSGGSTAAIVSR